MREDLDQPMTDDEILRFVRGCYREAEDAKRDRMAKNRKNQLAYMDVQDFSHKLAGQSTEFVPKVSTSAEQFSAFLKRALTQFGEWFQIELNPNNPPILTDGQVRNLMELYLHNIPVGPNRTQKIETIISDSGKAALMDSLMILKVHGRKITQRGYFVERGEAVLGDDGAQLMPGEPTLSSTPVETWRLCIDLVRPEDYFPDPTGASLYEIHETERDFHTVLDMANAGIYDLDAVDAIKEDYKRDEAKKRNEQSRGQNRAEPPKFRKKIVIREFWGTLLNDEGEKVMDNCLLAVANDKYVIRKPEENPFWHQESPFVVCPLLRVPHSVWHKALYDTASDLNLALNEMFNLMLDGGMSAVWGIKQLRPDYLEDPSQVTDGIPQGATLIVKENLPPNVKVLEKVTEGAIPQDAMAIFEMLNREFTQAALTNDIKLGSLPARQVKATEIVTADQNNAVTLDSISADIENDFIEPLLKKCWMTILQHVEEFDQEELQTALGKEVAAGLMQTSAPDRFAALAGFADFTVNGLSSVMTRVRDFQKTMGLMQMVGSNPILLQAFLQQYSEKKLLKQAMKQLNINPDDLARTPDELAEVPQVIQQMLWLAQAMKGNLPQQQPTEGGGGEAIAPQGPTFAPSASPGQGFNGVGPGGNELTSQVNQEANPLTGMRPM